MPRPHPEPRGYLPRLAPEFYRGAAVVFWTHPIAERGTGWLHPGFHQAFREIALHAAIRENLLCPIYTLMPDHLHLVWMGVGPDSNQLRACGFLRRYLEPRLGPHRFQPQAHDHVLRESERHRNAFAATCAYIADNPVRARLGATGAGWEFTGCLLPGYVDLHPLAADYWEKFWRVYGAATRRGRVGKMTPTSLLTSAATSAPPPASSAASSAPSSAASPAPSSAASPAP